MILMRQTIRVPSVTGFVFLASFAALTGCAAGRCGGASSGVAPPAPLGNRPERLEWFRDLGLGMFIHWSMDSQLGVVISHSMVGASKQYLDRYVNELPRGFNPRRFDPDRWAYLAKLCGMRYVVFTTKHHSGFCMFDTKTTDFSIMHTPYRRDITRQIVDAFRRQGIAVGFYYSPDDFWMLYKQGYDISRSNRECMPVNNPPLLAHDKAQLRELLTHYGPIDIMFLDGPAEELRELCWQLQPQIVITRGAMATPEQALPDQPIPGAWEACFTLGDNWGYKPTNNNYKSGTRLIEMLVETRAKGGNLLLNVGPTPDGEIPPEEEARLREWALWNFINGCAVFDTRPWHVIREGNIWFTRMKDADTVFAVVTGEPWPFGEKRTITLKSVRATPQTEIELLGQTGRVLEYKPDVVPKATWTQDETGLHITAMRAQRLYDNYMWPNPVVIRITHAKAATQ